MNEWELRDTKAKAKKFLWPFVPDDDGHDRVINSVKGTRMDVNFKGLLYCRREIRELVKLPGNDRRAVREGQKKSREANDRRKEESWDSKSGSCLFQIENLLKKLQDIGLCERVVRIYSFLRYLCDMYLYLFTNTTNCSHNRPHAWRLTS